MELLAVLLVYTLLFVVFSPLIALVCVVLARIFRVSGPDDWKYGEEALWQDNNTLQIDTESKPPMIEN
jgi:hypothetical protein